MNSLNISAIAAHNISALQENPYSGRGIVLGRTASHLVQIYWISGRSDSSRNRLFNVDGSRLFTELADPARHTGDTSLIIYNAMEEVWEDKGSWYVVSNGKQTDTVTRHCKIVPQFPTLTRALNGETFEPDAPNWTSRITGVCRLPNGSAAERRFELSILRRDVHTGGCQRLFFQYDDIPEGYGRCITTYTGDAPPGTPLPAFYGEPLIVPIHGDGIEHTPKILGDYWDTINRDNRVAIAVKMINLRSHRSHTIVHNRFTKAVKPVEQTA